jgi:putative ABC transport system permease protein
MLQDIRYALRSLWQTRRFTAVAIMTLALGIGTNAAIFGIVDRVLLRPLAFHDPDSLVRITSDFSKSGAADIGLSVPELFDYRNRASVFQDVAALYPANANLTDVDEPERIDVLLASANYFTLLGVDAELGRVFTQADEVPGNADVSVITDGLWARRFGRDPNVLGRTVRLDNDAYRIIGVLPSTFHHPGRTVGGEPEAFTPAGFTAAPYFSPPVRGIHDISGAIARLRPGVTVEQAARRLDQMGAELRAENAGSYPEALGWRPRVLPLQQDLSGSVRPALVVLMGAVGAVLLIACANVANLLLVRASARSREFAVRLALGATRTRLARQLLIESVLLAVTGGLAGWIAARWLVIALVQVIPAGLPRGFDVTLDARVLVFSLALSMTTGVLFGLWPAIFAPAVESDALKQSTRSTTSGPAQGRTRGLLVAAEFALALALLIVSSLFVRSFLELYAVDSGFSSKGVLTAQLWMPLPNDPKTGPYFTHDKRVAFYEPATERVAALPGVVAAGWTSALPLAGTRAGSFFLVEGQPPETAAGNNVDLLQVSPGYFRALDIGLVRGRLCTNQDTATTTGVVVVSESLARRYFGGGEVIGRRIRPGGPASTAPWLTIVGVVHDVRERTLDSVPPPQVYRCLWQSSSIAMTLVVKTTNDPSSLDQPIRAIVHGIDPDLPLYAVRPMDEVLASSLATRRFAMIVVGAFAVLALILSAIGVYGVLAFLVQQRTREIGVRVALGASRGRIVALVLRSGLGFAAAGMTVGLALAAFVARALASLLFGIEPLDPISFAGVPILLLCVAVLACYFPARRATRIDPLIALRQD